jgi:hypothetical protein
MIARLRRVLATWRRADDEAARAAHSATWVAQRRSMAYAGTR